MKNRRRLGNMLLERGVISEAQLDAALAYQKERRVRLGDAFLQLGYCDEVEISRALAEQLDLPFVNLDEEFPTPPILNLIRKDVAVRCQAVPVRKEEGRLVVVARNPLNFGIDAELRAACGMPVLVACGVDSQLARVLENYDRCSFWETRIAANQHLQYAGARLQNRASVLGAEQARGEQPSTTAMSRRLAEAMSGGASEVHLELEGGLLHLFTCQDGKNVLLGSLPADRLKLSITPGGGGQRIPCRVALLDAVAAKATPAGPYSAPVMAASPRREPMALFPRG